MGTCMITGTTSQQPATEAGNADPSSAPTPDDSHEIVTSVSCCKAG